MTGGWDIAADSPLLPFADGRARRTRFAVDLPQPGPPPTVRGLLAGAAEVDITPPPGLPKAGYSRNARSGTGFRTRLRARIVHLCSPAGALALVHCDLLGGSAVLHRLVARAIASAGISPAGLYIGATHTHAGPGQFLGSDFYNRFASNKAGFDPAWTQQVAERIAGGVLDAVDRRRRARLAVGSAEVWGLTRNRSLAAYVLNPSITDARTDRQRAYAAINPDLHLLRIDASAADGGFEPLAATLVFSVHGTCVPMDSDSYHADLWGYLVEETAHRIERSHGIRPVVGAICGTHADVAPAVHPGMAGHLEARRLGAELAAEAAALFARLDDKLVDQVELACGLREVDLDATRSAGPIRLPRRAAVGGAVIGGAYENETPLLHRLPPFRAGRPRRWRVGGPHGSKRIAGGPLQRFVAPAGSFPRILPLQVLRIGDIALVGLPFELTVQSGQRIAAVVHDQSRRAGVEQVIVTSVANDYAGYCTTPEEYRLQLYEGGHTLYGPNTQPFVASQLAQLAAETVRQGSVCDLVPERRFNLRQRRYLVTDGGPEVERRVLGGATFVDATDRADPCWELRWIDVAPGDLRWHEPLVRVEMAGGSGHWLPAVAHGRVVDDQGYDLEVIHLGKHRGGGHRYVTRWWRPMLRAGRRHRFVLVANGKQPELASEGFD